ncbi:hypothetical protein HB364_16610 [Pseudoflavitalea sp. X16]|uniref:hypothetical protein n=1 Tax=Paraflavitalea devenefica TaxID=2716334 RepID=UPI00141EE985|nr:hypothetical protein [Paraflavitalea devenefica]NII26712.1 hypothetical protein [Paraflavitalea devenefica]
MPRLFARLSAFILLSFVAGTASAQRQQELAILDALDSSFNQYTAGRQQPDLFLHIDKTIYVHQENIWFSAYILSPGPIPSQHTLYTLLIEEASKKIVLSERFVIDTGTAGGCIFLPDSLPTGEYRLLAYTNSLLNHPQQSIFQQSISIKASEATTFKLSLLPPASPTAPGDSVHFGYKVLTGYGGLASGGNLSYTLLADGKVVQTGKKTVNPFGEVNFGMLRQQAWGKKIQLQATITRQKEKQLIKTTVPLFRQVAAIRLYPEGGNLVHDHPSTMAIEIKNGESVPIATKGKLLKNGAPVALFETDQFGSGIIHWQPQQQATYTLQIADTALQLVYQFPPVAPAGYSLHVPDAVIEDSSFLIEIGAPAKGTCHLIAHNYRTTFFEGTLLVNDNRSSLHLSTADMPEGVITLTLFNAAGVPQAERAVYIRKTAPLQVQLITDSSVYHHRAKLQLKVKVTNSKGQPVKSIFSLACILASRIDTTRMADIVRFYYFDRFLPAPATIPAGSYLSSRENIERVLLTRFWTRYKWEVINTAGAYIPRQEKHCDMGYVRYRDRPVKKPVQMMILSGQRMYTFETDSTGYFELPSQALRTEAGKKAIILVSDTKNFKDYNVILQNNCATMDTALSTVSYPEAGYLKAELSVQEQDHLKKALQAVVVTAKKKDDYTSGTYKSLHCNDWVCMYNILNCPNHPTGSIPVTGGQYTYHGQKVIYQGCEGAEEPPGFMQQVNGVGYPKEFYVADYDKFNPAAPEMMSTVFWTYRVLTDEQGEAIIQFSTNDLNGRFACLLQGYSQEGVISGKTFFKVTE